LALEHATGQAYDVYTRQHILLPVGMSDAAWSQEAVDPTRLATL
jgi:CubicO group peptidase (beta-lactamase class C family)